MIDTEEWRQIALEEAPGKFRRLVDCLADHAVAERWTVVSAPERDVLIREVGNASATISRKLAQLEQLGYVRMLTHGGGFVGPTEWKLSYPKGHPKRHSDVIAGGGEVPV